MYEGSLAVVLSCGCCLCVPHRYAYFDTDNMIERAHSGETVAEIFKQYGEDYFRQCEEQVKRQETGGVSAVTQQVQPH
jgi:shikimate kinase